MQRPTFSVTSRFALVILVVVPSLLALASKGTDGLSSTRHLTDTLFNDIIATQHASAEMVAAMDDVHVSTLSALATAAADPKRSHALTTRLSDELIPTVDADLATVDGLHAGDDAAERDTITELGARWFAVRALWNSIA